MQGKAVSDSGTLSEQNLNVSQVDSPLVGVLSELLFGSVACLTLITVA